jgi:hypothetical protein
VIKARKKRKAKAAAENWNEAVCVVWKVFVLYVK